MILPRTVCSSSKRCSASARRAGSRASWLTPGTRVTQRCRPMTWTVAAAMPTPAIQRPSVPSDQTSQEQPGWSHQCGTDDQHEEPGDDGALVLAKEGEDLRGRLLQDLRVLEDGTEDRESGDGEHGRESECGAGEAGGAPGDGSSADEVGAHGAPPVAVGVGRAGLMGQAVAGTARRARYHARVVSSASSSGGRGDAERGAELGVVDDPGVGELVERVQVLPHRRA